MKRLRTSAMRRFPKHRDRMLVQDRFARKHGLRVLTVCLNLFLMSVAASLFLRVALAMVDAGTFEVPEEVHERATELQGERIP